MGACFSKNAKAADQKVDIHLIARSRLTARDRVESGAKTSERPALEAGSNRVIGGLPGGFSQDVARRARHHPLHARVLLVLPDLQESQCHDRDLPEPSFRTCPGAHAVFVGLSFADVLTALGMTVPRVTLKVIVRA